MKFRVPFKTPDTVDDAIYDELGPEPEDDDEQFDQFHLNRLAMEILAQKFVSYGEAVVIEFDTEAQTAVVVPVRG